MQLFMATSHQHDNLCGWALQRHGVGAAEGSRGAGTAGEQGSRNSWGAGEQHRGSSSEGAAWEQEAEESVLCWFESLRITEMHILNFSGTISMTDELSPHDKVMMLPPSGRALLASYDG